MIKKNEKKIGTSFEENIAYMEQMLPVKDSFDLYPARYRNRRKRGNILFH